jgi:cytochrome P450
MESHSKQSGSNVRSSSASAPHASLPMQSRQKQPEPQQCPYKNSVRDESKPRAISPGEALPIIPTTRSNSTATPPQLQQGWRNLARMQKQGPHVFFSKMAARAPQPFFKVEVGPKIVYQVADGKAAEELLTKHAKHLGRGNLLVPFKSMVGDVFFANDGPKAADTRKVFLNTVTRLQDNFQRINQVNERSFAAIELGSGRIPDLFAFVAWHTMGCIAKCFVGTDDLSAIPSDTHKTFMDATRFIAEASMDPVSRLIHPSLRSGFRTASHVMAHIATELLEKNIEVICRGHNYTWDLAVFRAKELHPEMNFDNCTHYDASNPQSRIVRNLIVNRDRFVLEHGPLTIFASSNVGATLYYLIDTLSRRPDVILKMREEINRVLEGQPFTYERINDLPYVRAVIQEALWQATPIPDFPREVLSPFETNINGETVSFQQGDMIMLLFRPMQGTTGEFTPERWLGGENNPTPTLFAFGAGHRRCPAQPFAKQLLMQFLVSMISHNLHIVPTARTTYTTRNGTLGPDYQPHQPIAADAKPIPADLRHLPVAFSRL